MVLTSAGRRREAKLYRLGVLLFDGESRVLCYRPRQLPFGWRPPMMRLAHQLPCHQVFLEAERLIHGSCSLPENQLDLWQGQTNMGTWQLVRAEIRPAVSRARRRSRARASLPVGLSPTWLWPIQIKALTDRATAYLRDHVSHEEWKREPGLNLDWWELFRQYPELLRKP